MSSLVVRLKAAAAAATVAAAKQFEMRRECGKKHDKMAPHEVPGLE